MAKYLFHGSYTPHGLQGLLKEGGSSRAAAVSRAAESLGGSVEAVYFAFGKDDFYVILDLPGNPSAAAISLIGNAAGAFGVSITVLMTPGEIDEAVAIANEKRSSYRQPGG